MKLEHWIRGTIIFLTVVAIILAGASFAIIGILFAFTVLWIVETGGVMLLWLFPIIAGIVWIMLGVYLKLKERR